MSEPSFFDDSASDDHVAEVERPRRRKRSPLRGCLPVLVVLAVLGAGGYAGFLFLEDKIDEWFAPPADYDGSSLGEPVSFEVKSGQSVQAMGRDLVELDVVKSLEAFNEAARAEDTTGIQAGWYIMRERMPAADAVAVLVDPDNLTQDVVTIPEGFTVDQIVNRLGAKTDFAKKRYRKLLADPAKIGLPDYAKGNPEGYLFPATYPVNPDDTPRTILTAMVDRYEQALGDLDIEALAPEVGAGYTPEQIMTVASLVEAEGRGEDMPKIARAIYNRLEHPDREGTGGLLQIDAAVLYALGTSDPSKLVAPLAELTDSPYNTYRHPGLPPGPIGSPGEDAIRAALNPAAGDWIFWITTECDGTTEFSETLEEHNSHTALDPSTC